MNCPKCGKKKWTPEDWTQHGQVVDADAQFDGGEWSEPAHDDYVEKYICLCPEACACGAEANHNHGLSVEGEQQGTDRFCCGGMMCCPTANE